MKMMCVPYTVAVYKCTTEQALLTCLYQVFVAEHVPQLAVLGHALSVRQYNEGLYCR